MNLALGRLQKDNSTDLGTGERNGKWRRREGRRKEEVQRISSPELLIRPKMAEKLLLII